MGDPIEEWFAAAGPREAELRRVDALVREAAPGLDRQLVPVGAGQVLGYGLMPYRPRSARETTQWPLVSLAAQWLRPLLPLRLTTLATSMMTRCSFTRLRSTRLRIRMLKATLQSWSLPGQNSCPRMVSTRTTWNLTMEKR